MNPYTTNPLMFILQADPARYVKTRPAALLALLKMFEAAAAVWGGMRAAGFLQKLAAGFGEALPIELFKSMLPTELTAALPHGTLPSGGTVGLALTGAAALCLFIELLCLALEGVSAPLLRFGLKGSKLFKITRRAAFPASVALALCVTVSGAYSLYLAFTGGMGISYLLRPALVTAGCALLLWLRVPYNRAASTVISAVEYEIRLGFKETVDKSLSLKRDAFLLCLVFLAAAAAICVFIDWRMLSVCIPALLAVKYGAVVKCWNAFWRCHH